MFKTFRARAGIFNVARAPLRLQSEAVQQGRYLNVQHVRFKQNVFRPRRWAISLIGICTTYYVFDAIFLEKVGSVLDDAADNIEKGLSEKEKQELDELAAEPLFLPFPFTIVEHKPVPYRGSDPEWQEFIKFSKDPALGKRVRDDLANMIKQSCEKHPTLIMRAGPDMKIRRHWLDVDFPVTAPPTFTRSGLEFGDDGIRWTQAPIDSVTVSAVRKVLYPIGPLKSFWDFNRSLVINAWNGLATTVGFKPIEQPTLEALLARHAMAMKQMRKENSTTPKADSEVPKDPLSATRSRDLPGGGKARNPYQGNIPGMPPTSEVEEGKKPSVLSEHFSNPVQSFKMKFLSTLTATKAYPPKGSIFVSGLVELDCSKAWIVVDVKAAWDPKTKDFDKRSMVVGLRRMQMKRQPPAS